MTYTSNYFPWAEFYSKLADRLLIHRNDRRLLAREAYEINYSVLGSTSLTDSFRSDPPGPIKDIDPFTTMSLFNRGLKPANRHEIASKLAQFLRVEVPTPNSFPDAPVMYSQNFWFFPHAYDRADDHIDSLWRVFADALKYVDGYSESNRTRFVESFNDAIWRPYVKGRLATGLHWIRPREFLPLDSRTQEYLRARGMIADIPKKIPAEPYLELTEKIKSKFGTKYMPADSFTRLALDAQTYHSERKKDRRRRRIGATTNDKSSGNVKQYDIKDIVSEGCFLDTPRLQTVLSILKRKKNLILQGPPGTGKTWLARRLAFALTGSKPDSGVRTFQFHPGISYEDFVWGWRPSSGGQGGNGGLALVPGPFLKAIEDAKREAGRKFVMVIEEINRGNPASIFGEMLTLMEKDKRKPEEALVLGYAGKDGKPVYVPDNLYIIGTMNTADRSIAMVDLALRRRFGFVSLKPTFNGAWKRWMRKHGITTKTLEQIVNYITDLNKMIEEDRLLGSHCVIGHSYVTPGNGDTIDNPEEWFQRIAESEIEPILEDYWAEDRGKLKSAKALLQKFGS